MIIEAALFLQLATACGEGVPAGVLAGINRKESGYDTLALNVNTNGKGQTVRGIKTLEQAKSAARDLIRQGRNFDAGIMQINSTNWRWLGLNIDNVFDPCTNIRAAATLLNSYGKYNTGSASRGIANGYAVAVWNHTQNASRTVASPTPREDACPIPRPPAWDGFGQARWRRLCAEMTEGD